MFVLVAFLVAAALRSHRSSSWSAFRWATYAGIGLWLIATVGITLDPGDPPRFEGISERIEIQSLIPLAGTIESFASMGDRVMSEEEHAALTDQIAEDLSIPREEVNLSRVVSGPSLATVLRDPVGNMLLFLPAGLLAPVGLNLRSWRRVAGAAAATSGLIESAQILVGWGSLGSIDDVIFNTAGALIGFAIWRVGRQAWSQVRI